jgi:hypothetical protein
MVVEQERLRAAAYAVAGDLSAKLADLDRDAATLRLAVAGLCEAIGPGKVVPADILTLEAVCGRYTDLGEAFDKLYRVAGREMNTLPRRYGMRSAGSNPAGWIRSRLQSE